MGDAGADVRGDVQSHASHSEAATGAADPPHFLFLHSTFDIRHSEFHNGGIAQLVERQLCKLDVRGSNPLASKARRA
jgi:hypothetical protein